MSYLPELTTGKIWTHKRILQQDIPNNKVDFNINAYHQDFHLFGIPKGHYILGVKIVVLVNFDVGVGTGATLYVGNTDVFPTPGAGYLATFVSDVNDCYGVKALKIPSGSDDTYQYGSFRWFSFSSPGSSYTTSTAFCLPQRTDAHDVLARVVVEGSASASISQFITGAVEITTQYTAI